MCLNYPGIKLEPALQRLGDKIKQLSSHAHDVRTTANQVISRRGKIANVCQMSKDENCTCKACKTTVFHCQICKFVTFLLPSSSWLLKFPINKTRRPQERHKIAYLTMKNSTFARFARAFSIFVHFAAVLALSTT